LAMATPLSQDIAPPRRIGMQGTVRPRMDPAFRLRLGAAACFVSLARRHRGVVRRLGRQPQLVAQRRVLPFQCRNADRQLINTRQQRRDQRVLLGSRQRWNIGHQTHQAVESRPRPQVNTTSQPAPAKLRRRCSAILPIAHPNRRVSKYQKRAHPGWNLVFINATAYLAFFRGQSSNLSDHKETARFPGEPSQCPHPPTPPCVLLIVGSWPL